jgi:hypothetical protein
MANGGDDNAIHLIHTVWSACLTLLVAAIGWLLRWNWNRINMEVDSMKEKLESKVDKSELKDVVEQLREGQKEIIKSIEKNNEIARDDRHSIRNALAPIALDVAYLKGKLLKEDKP